MYKNISSPLPDECLRGYRSRLAILNSRSTRSLTDTLLEISKISGISISTLVKQHTHLGYKWFVHGTNHGRSIDEYMGLPTDPTNSSLLLPTELPHLCPQCVSEDMDFHGISYWRRVHQLPGVDHCVKHMIPLIKVEKKDIDRKLPINANHISHAIHVEDINAYFKCTSIKNFTSLSDSALHSEIPIKPAVINFVISSKIRSKFGKYSISLRELALQKFPEFWLRRHFPRVFSQELTNPHVSSHEVFKPTSVGANTKSHLIKLALLWDDPDEAIRECRLDEVSTPEFLDETAEKRAFRDVLNGLTIRSSCNKHNIPVYDLEHAIRQFFRELVPKATTAKATLMK